MGEKLDAFLLEIIDLDTRSASELIDYFIYFLTVVEGAAGARGSLVQSCFEYGKIPAYSNIPAYLTKKSKRGKTQILLKNDDGYVLTRDRELEIQAQLHTGPARIETSRLLRGLLPRVRGSQKKDFLLEAIDCYEIGARRATIVLVWILAIRHLQEYIFNSRLSSFNTALAKVNDRRIKVKNVSSLDDFGDIPESKFIDLARSARIITNDVRKILDAKLGIRNSCAHPSGVSVSDVKTTDFVIDLVDNVVLKYV